MIGVSCPTCSCRITSLIDTQTSENIYTAAPSRRVLGTTLLGEEGVRVNFLLTGASIEKVEPLRSYTSSGFFSSLFTVEMAKFPGYEFGFATPLMDVRTQTPSDDRISPAVLGGVIGGVIAALLLVAMGSLWYMRASKLKKVHADPPTATA
jgi:hypothetical protein